MAKKTTQKATGHAKKLTPLTKTPKQEPAKAPAKSAANKLTAITKPAGKAVEKAVAVMPGPCAGLVPFDPSNFQPVTLLDTFDENVAQLRNIVGFTNRVGVYANWTVGYTCANMEVAEGGRYGKDITGRVAKELGVLQQRISEMVQVYKAYQDPAKITELEQAGVAWTHLHIMAAAPVELRGDLEKQLISGKLTTKQLSERVLQLEEKYGIKHTTRKATTKVLPAAAPQTGNTTAPAPQIGGRAATISGNGSNGLDHDPDAVDNKNKEKDEKRAAALHAFENSRVRIFETYRDKLSNAVISLGSGPELAAEMEASIQAATDIFNVASTIDLDIAPADRSKEDNQKIEDSNTIADMIIEIKELCDKLTGIGKEYLKLYAGFSFDAQE